ncbi:Putative phospholipid-transporting ATPase IK [Myotis brandtii]|uniref:Putative phospholipid-transporting ATPase IK n=1 Tax=Myotis brandtii TaxID=109478 RepID=S7MIT6_MYOBR|nr:Putative phospholipid-transporting ATPase IK [Myotis brandtii]
MYSVNTKSFLTFWGFPILYRVMVSIGMFNIDKFIYLGNSIFINLDMWINYESQEMAANPHSTSINDRLGQMKTKLYFKKNAYIWNKCADGKMLFQSTRLLSNVRCKKDRMVGEYWHLLAICHTKMVQEKDNQR